nr:hypothetical protein [uncultured Carboxylicivirga sp.]
MKIKNYFLTLSLFLTIISLSKAQTNAVQMMETIPSDSLLFAFYLNNQQLKNDSSEDMISEYLPSSLMPIIDKTDELCFYANKAGLHETYSLKLKGVKEASLEDMQSILNDMNLEVENMSPGFIKLKGEYFQKGYVKMEDGNYTIKIFVQTMPVDPQIRKEFNHVYSQIDQRDNYEYNEILYHQIDSLSKLDSINSIKYMDDLVEQGRFESDKKSKKIAIPKSIVDKSKDSPLIMYMQGKEFVSMPFRFYNMFRGDFYNYYDKVMSLSAIFNYYDHHWITLNKKTNSIEVNCLSTTKKKQTLYQPLDKDILSVLPAAEAQSICIYNYNLSELQYHLARSLYTDSYNNEKNAYTKLALLAIDDDVLDAISNGFIAITDGDLNGRDMPDFKIALKIANKRKGDILLDILQYDLKWFKKVKANCYTIRDQYNHEEKTINLTIIDDMWIIGTGTFEQLSQRISSDDIKKYHPQLSTPNLFQYVNVTDDIAHELDRHLKQFSIKTIKVDKKSVLSTFSIQHQ